MKRLLFVLALSAVTCACGSSSTSPTATPPATGTKIIAVAGNLAFGTVNIGSTATQTFTISNSGNAAITFTSLNASGGTGIAGYAASPTSGTVAPGATVTITVQFTPTIAQFYSCVLSVVGDQTAGGAAINVSGTGFNNSPLFTSTGVGNNVFTMPATVATLHITASYTGSSSNFIVWAGPVGSSCSVSVGSGCRLLVNVIIGTFGSNKPTYDSVIQTGGGGTVTVSQSDGVTWSMTEVR